MLQLAVAEPVTTAITELNNKGSFVPEAEAPRFSLLLEKINKHCMSINLAGTDLFSPYYWHHRRLWHY
ncbi:hypothetical protein PMI17_00475 [Pantoea sp. GM01]|nr:hypothetical protein PMI17_00475 [Pantoea sp. GM01]